MKYLISAGHGGTDPGACANGHAEAAIALEMRDLVAIRLVEMRQLGESMDPIPGTVGVLVEVES